MADIRGSFRILRWERARRGDAAVVATARAALITVLGEDADDLSLRVHGGVVTIRGEVDRMSDIQGYETIVRSVPGVVDVDNLLRLRVAGRLRPRVLSA